MLESNSDIAKLSLSLSSSWADLLRGGVTKKMGKFGTNSKSGGGVEKTLNYISILFRT